MFGTYVVSDRDPLDFLRDIKPEFEFLDALPGTSIINDLSGGEGLIEAYERLQQEWKERATREAIQRARNLHGTATENNLPAPSTTFNSARNLAMWIDGSTKATTPENVWTKAGQGIQHYVWQAPEGSGKSSIVPELVQRGFTVVFCSKSNDQLCEHEATFKSRWPDLRVHRFISRARHLQEQLREIDIEFTPTYYTSASPYAFGAVDEPTTRQNLRKALDEAGYYSVDHVKLFDKCFVDYKAERISGLQVDVVLVTLAAFQAFCTAKHRPWWHALGLLSGKKRIVIEPAQRDDPYVSPWGYREAPNIVESHEEVPKINEYEQRLRTVELGIEKIIVLIDDPDRNDFDFRRLIEDKHYDELVRKERALPKYKKDWVYSEHWRKLGYPELLAQALAKEWTEKAHEHQLSAFAEHQYEERPKSSFIGYGLQRGFRPNQPGVPKILVTTTEHITANLANRSLMEVMLSEKEPKSRNTSIKLITDQTALAHVTLLSTRLVRKKDHALLLLINEVLRNEFPDEDLVLIADGIGSDLNLLNNKGRNDLAKRTTLVKVSIPNGNGALNLWAQFPSSQRRRVLNTILLADLANQAIGRNQGNRFNGKPCVVLIDPMYANLLVHSGLLRYQCTPWSFHKPTPTTIQFHGQITDIERRMMEFLEPGAARRLGFSIKGLEIGFNLPDKQRKHYEDWLEREKMHIPWKKNE